MRGHLLCIPTCALLQLQQRPVKTIADDSLAVQFAHDAFKDVMNFRRTSSWCHNRTEENRQFGFALESSRAILRHQLFRLSSTYTMGLSAVLGFSSSPLALIKVSC